MSPLTAHQNSAQTDLVWLSKQRGYRNCAVLKWQQTEPTRYLSNLMFYSTNTQTNLRHWRVLSKEWDHQVWGQSNFVWVTNRWLEDVRSYTLKSRQISRSSLSLLHTLWCVFYTFILSISLYSSSSSSSFLWECRLRFSICGSQETT